MKGADWEDIYFAEISRFPDKFRVPYKYYIDERIAEYGEKDATTSLLILMINNDRLIKTELLYH